MPEVEATPLIEAAADFDEQLATYARLGELFVNAPLSSVEQLERANQLLGEIAGCEERLQGAGQKLARALAEARERQEKLAREVVAHVPAVQERNRRLQDLMGELSAAAGEVATMNTELQERGTALADAQEVSTTVLALSGRAEALAKTAREAEFEELAAQAHSLHQRLQAIGEKLAKPGGS